MMLSILFQLVTLTFKDIDNQVILRFLSFCEKTSGIKNIDLSRVTVSAYSSSFINQISVNISHLRLCSFEIQVKLVKLYPVRAAE